MEDGMRDDAKEMDAANSSGTGRQAALLEGVAGWSWGAFVFSWIWAIGNRTPWGLLGLVPGVGLVVRVLLGMKGREWAWRSRRWDSLSHFRRVQRRWNIAAGAVLALLLALLLAALALGIAHDRPARPAAQQSGEQLEL